MHCHNKHIGINENILTDVYMDGNKLTTPTYKYILCILAIFIGEFCQECSTCYKRK